MEELDKDIIDKILEIQTLLKIEKNVDMTFSEIKSFLDMAVNFDEIQTWIMLSRFDGKKLTKNDIYRKFFNDTSDDRILQLFDISLNVDEANIKSLQKKYN